jgi:predicted lipoprotein with Yx(FWY)xxD motif
MNINTRSRLGWTAVAAVALAALVAGCGSSAGANANSGAGSAGSAPVVGTAHNANGMTLYSLSAERNGRFVCTRGATVPGGSASCLSVWRPLIAHGQVMGRGVASLGTIVRPDGVGTQVTYKGLPLYTFAGDNAPGDASGNGFRDVGTWLAATGGGAAQPPASSGGGYGY